MLSYVDRKLSLVGFRANIYSLDLLKSIVQNFHQLYTPPESALAKAEQQGAKRGRYYGVCEKINKRIKEVSLPGSQDNHS